MIATVRIKFDKLYADTGKAILISICNKEIWLPKKMCRNLIINKKLGGNVVVPAWLAIEKGISYDDSDVETIIEKHIPDRVKPVNPQADAGLTR